MSKAKLQISLHVFPPQRGIILAKTLWKLSKKTQKGYKVRRRRINFMAWTPPSSSISLILDRENEIPLIQISSKKYISLIRC